MNPAQGKGIDEAHNEITSQVIEIPGVAGTAIGLVRGRPCVKVYLEADDAGLRARIPTSAHGHPVDVEVTGRVRKWP